MAVSVEQTVATLRARANAQRAAREMRAKVVRDRLLQVLRIQLPPGTRAWLIGSLAWGGFGDHSDVDLVLRGADSAFASRLEMLLTRELDVLVGSWSLRGWAWKTAARMSRSSAPPPLLALRAAARMMDAAQECDVARRATGEAAFQIGIGIASGTVALGILGSRERRTFTVIGHHVNMAPRLQGLAGPGEILVDKATYRGAAEFAPRFTAMNCEVEGIGLVQAYRWPSGSVTA